MIEIEDVVKSYQGTTVVDHISLNLPARTINAIVGTSGSGKTTLIGMINRLVEPTSGAIRIDGQDIRAVSGYHLRRQIGYVIQGNGLFPHWSVARNIATVPRLLGWDKARIDRRIDELLELFQLDPAEFRNRMPQQLSGGQQQRIGVARALAAGPNILLMDEPFGALDPVIRAKAQEDLLTIQRKLGTTIVLVTHDMDEAIRLGDRIAVMDRGQLLQYAEPAKIIVEPATGFVADLIGTADRPFRLLSFLKVEDHLEQGPAEGPPIAAEANLRDAYSELLWSGRMAAPVKRNGQPVGIITRQACTQRAAAPQ